MADDELDFEKKEFSKLIGYYKKIGSHKLSEDYDKNFYKKLEKAKPKISLFRKFALITSLKKPGIEIEWFPRLYIYRWITIVTTGMAAIIVILFFIYSPIKNTQKIAVNQAQKNEKTSKPVELVKNKEETPKKKAKLRSNTPHVKEIVEKEFKDVIFADIVKPTNADYRGHEFETKDYVPSEIENTDNLIEDKSTAKWKLNKKNGDVYKGALIDKKYNGFGEYKWKDGTIYKGDFKDGNINGKGVMIYTKGDKFEGEWLNNHKNGKGTYTVINKASFRGNWKDDEIEGIAILVNTDGESYSGEWKEGMAHGKGTYRWTNNDIYEGEWKFGEIEGYGTLTKANGEKYTGIWKQNKLIK